MDEEFVGQDRSVLVEEYFVEGHCWDLGDYDAAQGVRDGGLHALELDL